ncbi:MAG: HAD family phosphatase [Desulfotalea sp.]
MIKALIFDLDGTLVDSEMLHYKSWRDTLLSHGVSEFTFKTFSRFIGTSNEKVANDYINEYSWDIPHKELIREKQIKYLELTPEIPLYPGVKEIITNHYEKYTLALATSSHEKEAKKILQEHHLIQYFTTIMTGDMVVNKKPDPEIYLKTASKINIPPENCLAFEDSEHGVNAAKNANMKTVAIPNEHTIGHNLSRADLIINSLEDFTIKEIN